MLTWAVSSAELDVRVGRHCRWTVFAALKWLKCSFVNRVLQVYVVTRRSRSCNRRSIYLHNTIGGLFRNARNHNVHYHSSSSLGIPIPNPGIDDALIPGFRDYEKCKKNARILQDICPKNTFSPNFGGNSRL